MRLLKVLFLVIMSATLPSCAEAPSKNWEKHLFSGPGPNDEWVAQLKTKQDKGKLYYQFSLKDNGVHPAFSSMPELKVKSGKADIFDSVWHWDNVGGRDYEAIKKRSQLDNLNGLKLSFYDKQGFQIDELSLKELPGTKYRKPGAGWQLFFIKHGVEELKDFTVPIEFETKGIATNKTLSNECATFSVDKVGIFKRFGEKPVVEANRKPSKL